MIELEFHIPLSPVLVWEKLVDRAHIAAWWDEAVILDPYQGGRFSAPWSGHGLPATGEITAFEPSRRLQINFRQANWPKTTRVEFLLKPDGAGENATLLYMQQSGWDAIPDEAARSREVDAHLHAWTSTLKKFADYCVKGK